MAEPQPMKRQAGQTVEEMATQLRANTGKNRLNANAYPVISAEIKAGEISKAIDLQMSMAKEVKARGRVNLDDLDAVQATVERYLTACKLASVIPGISGLAAALGISRQWLNQYASAERTPSARYLATMRENFSAVLEHCALSRTASEPTAIFLLKNAGNGMSDRIDWSVQPVSDPNDSEITADDIMKRYGYESE